MAAATGSGGITGGILATLAATAMAGTITVAVVTAGTQDQLEQQQCSAPGENLVSQEVPTGSGGGGGSGGTIDGIPSDYMDLYSSAASEYGLDVAILAAVGWAETEHGSNMNTSSAGAQGPMQFMPQTWSTVGYDANGDGTADIMDPKDAIPSAARYLRDSGAPEDYHGALYSYNRSEEYVQKVLAKAEEYRASMGGGGSGDLALIAVTFPYAEGAALIAAIPSLLGAAFGMRPAQAAEQTAEGSEAAFPLPQASRDSYTNTWSTNEGTDFQSSEGTPVNSPVGGKVVEHNGSENSVMVRADYSVGMVRAGDMVFLDGLGKKGVSLGDKVSAGQQIGSVGSDGLHLGLYDPSGERAESSSGAYDSFPMMNWLAARDGEATGTAVEGPACETPQGAAGGPSGGGTLGGSGGFGGSSDSGGTTSGSGSSVVAEAEKYMGVPYLLGGPEVCVPYETMDCTCLTTTVYREFGYELPDHPQGTLDYGEPVDSPEPGDLVVFPDPGDGTGGHVGIAIGNDEMIHACLPCGEVTTGPISGAGTPNGYRRLVG
ncbi:MAG: lytic murein transglycosylase [Rubrobacteraceae bacterium]